MSLAVTAAADGSGARRPLVELYAVDLAALAGSRERRASLGANGSATAVPAPLPAEGFASPMGFWFYPGGTLPEAPAAVLRVIVGERAAPDGSARSGAPASTRPGQASRTVTLKVPNTKGEEVSLAIGPAGAHVIASRAAWESMSEAALLVIGQWWRFHAVEERLARLVEQARRDHSHASMPTVRTWRDGGRLVALDTAIRELVDDVSHVAGPLWEPGRYCGSEASAEVYGALCDGLDLEGWCQRIDERLKIVATTYEVIVDKLLHYKLSLWSIVLEVLIVALLAVSFFR